MDISLIRGNMSDNLDDLEERKARARKNIAIRTSIGEGLDDLLDDLVGTETRKQYRENLVGRGNIPSITEHFTANDGKHPNLFLASDKLWIVDRILEFQTVGQFITAAMGTIPLPTGEIIDQPLDQDEWFLITRAYSSWAPPPWNSEATVPIDRIVHLIGSTEHPYRMQLISKELQAMKSRIWEGIMPLSARRWQEKQLYEPENFSTACQILSMTINVFLYLNLDVVQAALRETFVLIDDVLRTFENALNVKRVFEGKPVVEVSKKWHQFVGAKYSVMVNRTHDWVMTHVEHMKSRVLEQLEAHGNSHGGSEISHDEESKTLLDMWQDLSEIASQADYAILIPMDGYDGSMVERGHPKYNFRTHPLSIDSDIRQRNLDYHRRRGHLTMKIVADNVVANMGDPAESQPKNDAVELLQQQDAGQRLARAELRGERISYEKEPWTVMIEEKEDWGFVAYRAHHSCSDVEWDEYRARFDLDNTNWGSELVGLETLRERSKIHWLDTKDLGVDGGDIDALKRSFKSFAETANFPSGFATDIFLVANEASVASYLCPQPESSPPGDVGGFINAIDADFDPSEGIERPDESPGYNGTLRILGSLLWDDLSALVASHNHSLQKLWPLAMNHPSHIYVGPVVTIRKNAQIMQ